MRLTSKLARSRSAAKVMTSVGVLVPSSARGDIDGLDATIGDAATSTLALALGLTEEAGTAHEVMAAPYDVAVETRGELLSAHPLGEEGTATLGEAEASRHSMAERRPPGAEGLDATP